MTLIDEGRVGVCYLRVDFLAWNMESQIQSFYQAHSGSFLDCRPLEALSNRVRSSPCDLPADGKPELRKGFAL